MLPGIPVHVVHRGNNREACFYGDGDRAFYLFHLRRLAGQMHCPLHAYCLMSNHVHLLLSSHSGKACGELMRRVAQLHSQYMNRTHGRSGSLWEGRYRSCLVQEEEYVLACYRYIDSNPVRAGMCSDPTDYEWSSCRANAGLVEDASLLPHEQYQRLGPTPESRGVAYIALFKSDPRYWRTDEIRKVTNGNLVLGNDAFRRKLALLLGRRVEPGKAGRPASRKVDAEEDLLSSDAQENVVRP